MAVRTAGCLWTARLSRTTTSPGAQRRHQDLLDVGEKGRRVDRSVEHRGRAEPVESERRDHRVGLPMTARRVVAQPHAAQAPAIAPQQIGCHPTFVEEQLLPHITQRLPGVPLAPGRGDIRPALLVGVHRFF